jgi:2-polyprenyl-6-methoxyphenol hydroxylase-like FAD-dependent oxidoreductase
VDRRKVRVAVVGAGIAGLAATLAFARAGHRVILIEKDAALPPPTPDASFLNWDRPGVPQRRLAHSFLPLARKGLQEHLPDAVDRLVAAGGRHIDLLEPVVGRELRPGDDELVTLRCRRTVFEWVLRQMVDEEPGASVAAGDPAAGLAGTPKGVTGVRLSSGDLIEAELVVDASGRRSSLPEWLRDLGAPGPEEERQPCGIVYFTRYYERRDPSLPLGFRARLGYAVVSVGASDGRTFSLTFFARAEEPGLRRLRDGDSFERAVATIDGTAPWLESATPIGAVNAMGALANSIRRFALGGRVLVPGVLAIGDAISHTDPSLGRGMSLALDHAFTAASLNWTKKSSVDSALEYHARIDPLVDASYADAAAANGLETRIYGGDSSALEEPRAIIMRAIPLAAAHDQDLFRANLRNVGLLDTPGSIVSEPWIGRARTVLATSPPRPSPGPDLQTMLELLNRP